MIVNNIENKLDALIDALGFDVEEVVIEEKVWSGLSTGEEMIIPHSIIDYKVTKKSFAIDVMGMNSVMDDMYKNKYKMAYDALRNQVQLHMDSGCLDVVAIDLRKQIELCEGYINEDNT